VSDVALGLDLAKRCDAVCERSAAAPSYAGGAASKAVTALRRPTVEPVERGPLERWVC
jgi:hypothetical protein